MNPLSEAPSPEQAVWIEWNGGACPVPKGTAVDVMLRSGDTFSAIAGEHGSFTEGWKHVGHRCDIVAYRVHVSTAAPAAGGWIECHGGDNPCPPGVMVEWQTRAMPGHVEAFGPAQADLLDWRHHGYGDDIVSFRIVGDIKMRDQRMTASEALRRYSEPMLPRESEESILREAERIVHGDRAVDYGEIKEAYARIAGMWSIII